MEAQNDYIFLNCEHKKIWLSSGTLIDTKKEEKLNVELNLLLWNCWEIQNQQIIRRVKVQLC